LACVTTAEDTSFAYTDASNVFSAEMSNPSPGVRGLGGGRNDRPRHLKELPMTATLSTTRLPAPSAPASASAAASLWRTGVGAGLAAAVATTAVAALSGASFETAPGDAIPLLGFAQLTLLFTAVGVGIAAILRRRSVRPRSMFLRTTLVLTAVSVVPDLLLPTDAASKITLVLTHAVAAAIVIPALASRLADHR
jgi:hypothetical protein